MITVVYNKVTINSCNSVIIIPEIAVTEPGYIKAFSSGAESGAKHEFHALAQMAYYQYQDDELECIDMVGECRVSCRGESEIMAAGAVIYRNGENEINILAHTDVNRKKLLEAANRYCTRWVRLDI